MKYIKRFIIVAMLLTFGLGSYAQSLTRISYMPHWLHQAQFAGFYMAKEKGLYENYGLDVDILDGGPASPVSKVLGDGDADFGTMFLSGGIELMDSGSEVLNVAQLSQKSALMFVARKSDNIETIQDFNGKKIGIWRSDFRELPMAFIDKYDIDAEIVPITSTINLFLDGGIEIMCVMWYNEYNQIYNSGIDLEDLNTFFFFDYELNFPEDGIYCMRSFYEENPEEVEGFVKASIEGWDYAFAHKDEALQVVMSYMKKRNVPANMAHQRWMLNIMEKVYHDDKGDISAELNKEDFEKTMEVLLDCEAIQNPVDFESFYLKK